MRLPPTKSVGIATEFLYPVKESKVILNHRVSSAKGMFHHRRQPLHGDSDWNSVLTSLLPEVCPPNREAAMLNWNHLSSLQAPFHPEQQAPSATSLWQQL